MNTLRDGLNEFLATRRASGVKLRAAGYALLKFVSFMEQRGACYITTALSIEWARQVRSSKSLERACAQHLGFVREFALHRLKSDPRTEVPPYGLLPHPKTRGMSQS